MKKILTGAVALSLVLTGCSWFGGDEKQAFIDATVEATCLIFQAEDIFDPSLETEAKAVYKKHGFDADDDSAMEVLTTKYQDDQDVQDAIAAALESCAGDTLKGLQDSLGNLGEESAETTEEAATEEPAAETTEQ
ncbi:hypothetical protein COU74_02250 [Candidatus Peregrinibacteria bacterium CG10_big_fil_rev_8_21_14_0_10_36_19]|nr:MAG: hypothetical protein COU74_02250 [Candidatus Peregrinibacteria bacterium CG10_big_fil_rev_8_21_14_0_10_36_19]